MRLVQTQKPITDLIVIMKLIVTMIQMLMMKVVRATCHKLLWTALHVRAASINELYMFPTIAMLRRSDIPMAYDTHTAAGILLLLVIAGIVVNIKILL